MKKRTVIIIVAICLVVAGIACLGAAMAMSGFSFEEMSTDSYEEVTHNVEGDFKYLVIATEIHNIDLLPSDDGVCKVVGDESNNMKINVECDGEYLTVKTKDTRKWYDFIGISIGQPSLRIYLPEAEYVSLTAASDTGNINVPEDFRFTGASVATDTGAIVFRASIEQELALASDTGSISVSKQKLSKIEAETSTGKITLESIEVASSVKAKASTGRVELHEIKCNSLSAETTTGSVTLKNVIAENEIKVKASTGKIALTSCISDSLNVKASTGDVNIYASDAASIEIETSTGDVEGSLLTPKIFSAESDTGKVRVPQNGAGGKCKIKTDTGNIKITIE